MITLNCTFTLVVISFSASISFYHFNWNWTGSKGKFSLLPWGCQGVRKGFYQLLPLIWAAAKKKKSQICSLDRDVLLCSRIKNVSDCPNSQPPLIHLETVPSANSDIQSRRYHSLCLVLESDGGKLQTHHGIRFLIPSVGTEILPVPLGHFTTFSHEKISIYTA